MIRLTRSRNIWVAAALLSAALLPASARSQGTLADYQRASDVIAKINPSELMLNATVEPHWIGTTHKLWYMLQTPDGGKTFMLDDAEHEGKPAPAFDHARLATALTTAAGKTYEAGKLPFDRIEISDDGQSVRFRTTDQGWRLSLSDYSLAKDATPLAAETPAAGPGGRRGRGGNGGGGGRGGAGAGRGGQSADGQWRVAARDNNLYLTDAAGKETQLTKDGDKNNYYRPGAFSPDSKSFIAYRTKPGDHLDMYLINTHPDGQIRPTLDARDYALPGDKLDVSEMYLVNVATQQATKLAIDPIDWNGQGPGLPNIHWAADGKSFLFRQDYRGYQRCKIQKVDAATGKVTVIMDSKNATFINPLSEKLEYLDDTKEILWTSERDGWNHLYLLDADQGGVKQQVTKGEWVFIDIVDLDRAKRQLIFTASGREPGEDPYLVHYYRVNLDGTGLTLLDPGKGTHTAVFSPDKQYLVDTYSFIDTPPVTALYRISDGKKMAELAAADISKLKATKWLLPEPFAAAGRDGKTEIDGVIWRPSNLDASKKYPVIEDNYGGPQGFFAPKAFVTTMRFQALAELGFIVVKMDGMGTSGRSKAFHDVCYKNLGDSGFPDRIAWIKAAAAKYPYMDLDRVGIYGTSAGGYCAARALIAHPEFYKVAVSNSGNQDHRLDKVWWNELYMGYPVGPWYAEQSNIAQAAKMQGKLLLVVGGLDENVNPFAETYELIDALEKVNKDYELLVFPEDNHGTAGIDPSGVVRNKTSGPYRTRKTWDFFVKNLLSVAPPADFKLDPSGPATFYRDNTN